MPPQAIIEQWDLVHNYEPNSQLCTSLSALGPIRQLPRTKSTSICPASLAPSTTAALSPHSSYRQSHAARQQGQSTGGPWGWLGGTYFWVCTKAMPANTSLVLGVFINFVLFVPSVVTSQTFQPHPPAGPLLLQHGGGVLSAPAGFHVLLGAMWHLWRSLWSLDPKDALAAFAAGSVCSIFFLAAVG